MSLISSGAIIGSGSGIGSGGGGGGIVVVVVVVVVGCIYLKDISSNKDQSLIVIVKLSINVSKVS
jgi:hypothetical protein